MLQTLLVQKSQAQFLVFLLDCPFDILADDGILAISVVRESVVVHPPWTNR